MKVKCKNNFKCNFRNVDENGFLLGEEYEAFKEIYKGKNTIWIYLKSNCKARSRFYYNNHKYRKFSDYFYTNVELRKLKLEKLDKIYETKI